MALCTLHPFSCGIRDKTLTDMSDGEQQSLITELDVIYEAGDPWYGSEKLTPPTMEKSANRELVRLDMAYKTCVVFVAGLELPSLLSFFFFSPFSCPAVTFLARRTLENLGRLPTFISLLARRPCCDLTSPCDSGAYAYTEALVKCALDAEQPDLVIFTGDQLNGQGTSWDAMSMLQVCCARDRPLYSVGSGIW